MFNVIAIEQASLIAHGDDKIIKAQTFEAITDADEIIRQVLIQKEEIIALAQKEREQQRELGYQQGLQQGKKALARLHLDATVKVQDFLGNIAGELTQVVTLALSRIIDDLAPAEVTAQIIKQSLKLITVEKSITLRVAPEQSADLAALLKDIHQTYPATEFIHIEADQSLVGQKGCILETETGVVDALLDSQLETIKDSLKNHFSKQ